MTSQKSSANPRLYTFRTALSSNFLPPLLNALVLTFVIPVLNLVKITAFNDSASMEQGKAAATLKETYKYVMLMGGTEYSILAILSTVVCSVLLGVMIFRFIASKKTVNVFYSLGITRKSLFVSKYLAGILMLVVSVALPLLFNLILNFSYLGSSWQLWSATAYYFWSFSILACFAFTVTAAVFSCVGTVAEGCFFPFVILGSPMIILYCLQYLMETLYGNPYGHYLMGYRSVDLPTAFKSFNPLLFLYDGISNLSALDAEGKLVPSTYGEGTPWAKPDFLPLVFWTVAIVAVMFLGMYLFRRRKAEICGFLGVNPVLNFLITFLLGFFGFGLVIHFAAEKLSMALAILIGLLVFTVIYCIVDFALIRNGKEFLRGLVKLPVHLGITLIIGVIFATGLFGFSSRIPELSEIKSVAVTVPVNTFNGLQGNSAPRGDSNYRWGAMGGILEGITGEENIGFVRNLHEQIVKKGKQEITADKAGVARNDQIVRNTVQVVYELKNGKKLMRFYDNVQMEVVNQLLNVEDTQAGRECIRSLLTKPVDQGNLSYPLAKLIQEDGALTLVSPYMEKETPVTLSQSQRKALLQCVADDLTAQKAAQRYFPTEPLIGLINIQNSEMMAYTGGDDSTRSPYAEMYEGYTIFLTKDMKKTIQFLQLHGLYDSIGQPVQVESLEVVRAKENAGDPDSYGRSNRGICYNSWFYLGAWQSVKSFEMEKKRSAENAYSSPAFSGAVKIKDAKQAQEVVSLSHIAYFYGVDGYFVRAKLADGKGYTCMFLPESVAPQYVKDAVK